MNSILLISCTKERKELRFSHSQLSLECHLKVHLGRRIQAHLRPYYWLTGNHFGVTSGDVRKHNLAQLEAPQELGAMELASSTDVKAGEGPGSLRWCL